MKINDIKHNHSLTDLLKVILFALIMLAPIGSIASRCLYVICNKNAYQSYYGETINQSQNIYVENTSNIKTNQEYYLMINKDFPTDNDRVGNYIIYFNTWDVIDINNLTLNDLSDMDNIQLYYSSGNSLAVYFRQGNTNLQTWYMSNTSNAYLNIKINLTSYSNNLNEILPLNILYTIQYNKYSYLDNVFEYSVSNIENNQLFNWTENTALYTGINAMCTNLQIGGSAIPIILTYWTLITIIYVIIDIVLKMFTTLTHLLSKKT